jgi:N-methylhydantoinase A/oxoprolinase/acetone carboxylase beta subunit
MDTVHGLENLQCAGVAMWRVGIDVGGTFTDLFAWEEDSGKSVTAKVLTTK